jgi:hypothetical protein
MHIHKSILVKDISVKISALILGKRGWAYVKLGQNKDILIGLFILIPCVI